MGYQTLVAYATVGIFAFFNCNCAIADDGRADLQDDDAVAEQCESADRIIAAFIDDNFNDGDRACANGREDLEKKIALSLPRYLRALRRGESLLRLMEPGCRASAIAKALAESAKEFNSEACS